MVSIHTSSQISMNPETLVETSAESVGVTEASDLTAEERKQNATDGKEENPTQSSNSVGNSSETDEKDLKHFSEDEFVAERDSIKAEGNDMEEIYHRDTKMETPSSMESFSENFSSDSDSNYIETETSKSQGNAGSYEQKYSSEKQLLRARFRKVVVLARKALAEARVAAQEQSVAKRYEVAAQKKRELQKRRSEKRREMLAVSITPSRNARNEASISSKIETKGTISWDKTEMKEIRKVHAELDRAKAKKTQVSSRRDKLVSVSDTTALQPTNKNSEYLNYEVECLVKELHSLNLPEKASELARAFSRKVDTEHEMRSQLKKDKREAMLEAKRQKLEEMARLREEERRRRLEEREREERERREREEIERMKKLEADRRQKIHNLHMWASFHRTGLANSVSRPFTSSYFPKLYDHASSEETRQTSEYSRVCALRFRCHKGHSKTGKTHKKITKKTI